MSESKHTLTPLEVFEGGNFLKIRRSCKPYEPPYLTRKDNDFICELELVEGSVEKTLPDAALIVLAVNSYEKSQSAMKQALEYLSTLDEPPSGLVEMLREAVGE